MHKMQMDRPQVVLGSRSVVLVGANVDDRPNFMTVGACGGANLEPPMISVAIRHERYTFKGIRQNMTFSVNVPSIDLVKETDYCGLVSGFDVNKVEACQFKVFYGRLKNAPLVEQFPINMEFTVAHFLNLGSNMLVIGKLEETHISETCLTNGKPDVEKMKTFIFTREPENRYLAVGQFIAKSHSIGKVLKKG